MLLAIYLNDHLAGSTVGRDLAQRAAANNRGSTYGTYLDQLAGEIDEDRRSLLEIMRLLSVRVDRFKVAAGWGVEKLGRLKPNGRVRGYSPLSRVVEIEVLALGVHGKLALWLSLQEIDPPELRSSGIALPDLIARAQGQRDRLETERLRAVADAFN